MALVVLLKGVNVGGHRSFRPAQFVQQQLSHLDATSVGATGVFVIKRRVARAALRKEISDRLPFAVEVMICEGKELAGLLSHPAFQDLRVDPDDVRFVSILSRRPRQVPRLPFTMPSHGKWLVKVIAHQGRYVLGVHRRHMKVISHLGAFQRIYGAPVTTRSLKTIEAIAEVIGHKTP